MYNLKSLREEKGLNMKELAKLLNISYTTYVGYEKDQRDPSSDVLIKIADFYNTTVDYVLGAIEIKSLPSSLNLDNIISIPLTKKFP